MTRGIALVLLLFAVRTVWSEPVYTDQLALSCQTPTQNQLLACDYRLKTPEHVQGISAKVAGTTLAPGKMEAYPWQNAFSAILLMVDTSDPLRENVIEQNKKQIKKLLEYSRPHHRIGFASFDKSLRLEVPVGTNQEQIQLATGSLRAVGQTTELFRSALTAIELLGKVNADRKFIFLMSDGLAEDKAYFHDDVVTAARKAGVVIIGLGYPRSTSQSVALQTLRRLSDETGGVYVEADSGFNLPETFLTNPYASIDTGGRFTIDLSTLPAMASDGGITLQITFATASGNISVDVPLPATMAVTKIPAVPPETKIAIPQPAPQPIQIITRTAPEKPSNTWFWYGIPAVLIILLIITITVFIITTWRQNKKQAAAPGGSFTDFKPYAYLVVQDETKKRYSITRTTWRIGRSKDNEMTLRDSSVSRRHAEIHRDRGDVFTIYDLDSLNGIFVNSEKITTHTLHEGDIIEIGDICLRFTLLAGDYTLEDSTAMQNTRAPMTH